MPDLLEEAKRLSEAATPGPWLIRDSEVWWISTEDGRIEVVESVGSEHSPVVRANAEFIVRSISLIPELVERVEQDVELREAVEGWAKARAAFAETGGSDHPDYQARGTALVLTEQNLLAALAALQREGEG